MAYKQLSEEERYQIAAMRKHRFSVEQIAKELGRHRSTIYRELNRNRSAHDNCYRPSHAGEKTRARRSNSKRNQRYGPKDFVQVEQLLKQRFSPEQIAGRAKYEEAKLMSHETIYRWIWADQSAGGTAWKYLRGARKMRRKRYGKNDSRGRLAGKRMISERPTIVEQRARLGDLEIDTVHGRGKAAVLTIVDRVSGLAWIGKLARATAELTTERAIDLLHMDKDRLFTITSDNGSEFHSYKDIEASLGASFYFANPHHAWERGSNENFNGLLRQYLPKRTNLKNLSDLRCQQIADELNDRPRKRLGFKTPNEVFYPKMIPRRFVASCGKP